MVSDTALFDKLSDEELKSWRKRSTDPEEQKQLEQVLDARLKQADEVETPAAPTAKDPFAPVTMADAAVGAQDFWGKPTAEPKAAPTPAAKPEVSAPATLAAVATAVEKDPDPKAPGKLPISLARGMMTVARREELTPDAAKGILDKYMEQVGATYKEEGLEADAATRKDLANKRAQVVDLYNQNKTRMEWMQLAEMMAKALAMYGAAEAHTGANALEIGKMPGVDWNSKFDRLMAESRMATGEVKDEQDAQKDQERARHSSWMERLQTARGLAGADIGERNANIRQNNSDARAAEMHNADLRVREAEMNAREDARVPKTPKAPSTDAARASIATAEKELSRVQGAMISKDMNVKTAALEPEQRAAFAEGHKWLTTDRQEIAPMLIAREDALKRQIAESNKQIAQLRPGVGTSAPAAATPTKDSSALPRATSAEELADDTRIPPGAWFVWTDGKSYQKKSK